MWITIFPKEHLQGELNVEVGRILSEHGLETDKVIASSGGSEEEAVVIFTLLTDDSMTSRILNKAEGQ